MDSLVLQTAIGLAFIFATVAALVSVITESVSRYVGLRAEYLLRGLRTLLDGGGEFKLPLLEAVSGHVRNKRKNTVAAAAKLTAVPAAAVAVVTAATRVRTAAVATADQAAEALTAATGTAAEGDARSRATAKAAAADAAEKALQAAKLAARSVTEDAGTSGPAIVSRVLAHPLIGPTANMKVVQGKKSDSLWRRRPAPNVVVPRDPAGDAVLSNKQRRQLPSYISARSFAQALIDLIVPDSAGGTTMTQVRSGIAILPPAFPDHLRNALLAMDTKAVDDITTFRTNLEHWYDDQMARVSGWYKRHVRWISAGIGLVLVIAFNLNVLVIARSLYSDQAVRGSVVTQATSTSHCTKSPALCLQDLRDQIGSIRGSGVPLGWATVPACATKKCSWAERRGFWRPQDGGWHRAEDVGLFLLGWVLMGMALLPGASFWFDLLGRLGNLRSTGPKPATH